MAKRIILGLPIGTLECGSSYVNDQSIRTLNSDSILKWDFSGSSLANDYLGIFGILIRQGRQILVLEDDHSRVF
jgi:hypothetical protein